MYRLIIVAALVTGCTVNVTNTNPKIGIGEKATVKTDVKAGAVAEQPKAEPEAAKVEAEVVKPEPVAEARLAEAPAAEPSVPVISTEVYPSPRPKGPCFGSPTPEWQPQCAEKGFNEDGWLNP